MKSARLFLSVLAISILAACGDTVTGPRAEPDAKPLTDETCVRLEDGTCATGQTGSGG